MGAFVGFKTQTRRINAQTAVVELHGDIDIYSAQKAKAVLGELLDEGCNRLVINLRHASYLDSSGLGMLVGTLRRVREQEGKMRLAALPSRVRRLFEITRLTYAFPIDASEEEAMTQMLKDDVPST